VDGLRVLCRKVARDGRDTLDCLMSCLDGEDNFIHYDVLVNDTLSLSQKAMPA
jgi:hypothetical protein